MKATGWFLAISLPAGVPPANGAEHKIRFDVRRPGMPGVASAEFEHRVQPEPRR